MKTVSRFLLMLTCFLTMFSGCQQQQPPPPPPDESATAEAAIRVADASWSKTAESKNLDAMVAYYTDDAIGLPPNMPTTMGKEATRKVLADMFAAPGFSLSWKVTKAGAAKSGETGWTVGTYELTVNDAKGKPTSDHGKYVTIWKKEADGSWKVAVDGFSSDLPPMAVSAPAPASKK